MRLLAAPTASSANSAPLLMLPLRATRLNSESEKRSRRWRFTGSDTEGHRCILHAASTHRRPQRRPDCWRTLRFRTQPPPPVVLSRHSLLPPNQQSQVMPRSDFRHAALAAGAVLAIGASTTSGAVEPAALIAMSAKSPAPPWPAGDQRGMANGLGEATTLRCGWHLTQRVRALTRPRSSLQHDAEVTLRQPLAEPAETHGRRAVLGTRVQQRGLRRRRRAAAAGHTDRRPRALRFDQGAVEPEGSVPRPTMPATTAATSSRRSNPAPLRHCSSSASRTSRRLLTTALLLDAKSYVGKGACDGRMESW